MKGKTLMRPFVYASLALVTGLCGLTAFATVRWMSGTLGQADIWEVAGESGQVIESTSYTAAPSLEIRTSYGAIQVIADDVDQIEVQLTKTAWGGTVEEAEANAAELMVTVAESPEKLSLAYDRPEEFGLGWRAGVDHVDFIVRVPAETAVDLQTSFGGIKIAGLSADAKLESGFGEIEVNDLSGGLNLATSNSTITIRSVEAGEAEVYVENSFGEITAEDVHGAVVTIQSSNGSITAKSVYAPGTVSVGNDFGDINLSDVHAAELVVHSQNGQVGVDGGELGGSVTVTNDFGDIRVTGLAASDYALSTSNGNLTLTDPSGSLILDNNFGDITVTGAVDAVLDLESSNGGIRFSGSLAAAEQHVVNEFGDITLTIPAESAFDVLLKTEFGGISSDIPLSQSGTLDTSSDEDRVQAAMNGGGPLLQAETSNGSIAIEILPAR